MAFLFYFAITKPGLMPYCKPIDLMGVVNCLRISLFLAAAYSLVDRTDNLQLLPRVIDIMSYFQSYHNAHEY